MDMKEFRIVSSKKQDLLSFSSSKHNMRQTVDVMRCDSVKWELWWLIELIFVNENVAIKV